MANSVYWDNFSGRPVSVREKIAPPERYTEIFLNPADVYIEHWAVTRNGTDARCDVAYSKTSYSIPAMVDTIRDGCFDGAVPVRMIWWEVPKDHYERILKRMEEQRNGDR